MKTIFIFDDSRPTDALHRIVALGEDGQRIAAIQFDGWTMPFCRFAMGAVHAAAEGSDLVEVVNSTRAKMLIAYDRVYGAGNWSPMWLETPKRNDSWLTALRLAREHDERIEAAASGYASASLAKIFSAVFGAAETQPHTTH